MVGGGGKRKGEKAAASSAAKRDVPAQLEPLDYKPTPKEDFDLVQLSKKPSQSGKHAKTSRPLVLESLVAAPQYHLVTGDLAS